MKPVTQEADREYVLELENEFETVNDFLSNFYKSYFSYKRVFQDIHDNGGQTSLVIMWDNKASTYCSISPKILQLLADSNINLSLM